MHDANRTVIIRREKFMGKSPGVWVKGMFRDSICQSCAEE